MLYTFIYQAIKILRKLNIANCQAQSTTSLEIDNWLFLFNWALFRLGKKNDLRQLLNHRSFPPHDKIQLHTMSEDSYPHTDPFHSWIASSCKTGLHTSVCSSSPFHFLIQSMPVPDPDVVDPMNQLQSRDFTVNGENGIDSTTVSIKRKKKRSTKNSPTAIIIIIMFGRLSLTSTGLSFYELCAVTHWNLRRRPRAI